MKGTLYYVLIFLMSFAFFSCGEEEKSAPKLTNLSVPEGFVIEEAVSPDLLSYPMFASFDSSGRLFVFEATEPNSMGTEAMLKNPLYHIRLLEDKNGDGVFDKSGIFADKIPLPMGGTFYHGSLYIAAPPNLVRLTDTDGDGVSDKRDTLLSGWKLHANAATLSGPFFGPDGWMYLADARRGFDIITKEGKSLKGKGARIWRCHPDGSGLESYAGGGFDNSVELAFMPSGETLGTMTYFVDPRDGQRDAIMHWVENGVYPKPNEVIQEDKLKLTGELMPVMTKLPRVAPAGLMRYRGKSLGQEYDGNLFYAEFNTGRIMRHIIKEAGATYSGENSPFMTSPDTDTHPTDVLQDADGSLLVVITGGWFIEGCPLSRVAKPQVKGGLYRIRKKDMPKVSDARGKELHMEKLSPKELAAYLRDPRFAVRDQAAEALVTIGEAAVEPLVEIAKTGDEELRTSVVFALYRIHSSASMMAVRSALADTSAMVRTAAARVAGLAKDTASVNRLMEMVRQDKEQVRRQAATALGQIGESKAVAALLLAAEKAEDRFVEHAIISALTSLGDAKPLTEALQHTSSSVRKTAVIALDQMDKSPLTKKDLAPFLGSDDKALRQTGAWIAAHRPAWGDIVLDFVNRTLSAEELSPAVAASVGDLLITFSEDKRLQGMMAGLLNNPSAAAPKKLFLLDIIGRCPLEQLPASWIQSLENLLSQPNEEVRFSALGLIESRSIASLGKPLQRLITDDKTPTDIRFKALRAYMMNQPKLSNPEFSMILNSLGPQAEAPIRQQAALLLVRADLDNGQLQTLASSYLPKADAALLPSLVEAFQGGKDEKAGQALVSALGRSTERLDNLSEESLRQTLSSFPESVRQSAGPVIKILQARHAERLSKLNQYESKLVKGDVGEGRKIFFGKGTCFTCHSVGKEGGTFAPDLTNIGEIRSRHDILEAILFPSASFAREYETSKVTAGAKTYMGIIARQLPEAIALKTGPGAEIRIPRSSITAITPHTTSMMPPGLDQLLSQQEMSDLMAFMEALPYSIERMIEAKEKQ